MGRSSFWSRLTGAFEEEEPRGAQDVSGSDPYEYPRAEEVPSRAHAYPQRSIHPYHSEPAYEAEAYRRITPMEEEPQGFAEETPEEEEGELSVDLYETPDELIVKAIVAGVKPEDLDIAISRDLITIRGSRLSGREVENGQVLMQEVFWGAFARTLSLPSEVDIESAQATVKDGVLTIRLPKIDKYRQRKIKVKTL
ncbi:Hsp20/alpha crystallin family protein [Candidatus Parcubacteria bacterium]|nr:MAG: Hsp20/alpha crystallin family protein [Candidatus Parcubacteria bacterium]GIW69130.1 MAG: hypothetical protein KatS3mg100_624 [Candidatus Parcubacteria bacterium]